MANTVTVPNDGQTYQIDQPQLPTVKQRSVLNLGATTVYIGYDPQLMPNTATPLPPGGQYPVEDKRALYAVVPSTLQPGTVQVTDSLGSFAQVIPQTRSIDTWSGVFGTNANNNVVTPLQNTGPGQTSGNNHVTVTFNTPGNTTTVTVLLAYSDGTTQSIGSNKTSPFTTDVVIKPLPYTVQIMASGSSNTTTITNTATVTIIPE